MMDYFWLFISGLLAFNSLPHFIHGISGEKFFLPSRNRTKKYAPLANVVWGFANFLVAVIIWNFVFGWPEEFFVKILVILAGGLVLAIVMSQIFAHRAARGDAALADLMAQQEDDSP